METDIATPLLPAEDGLSARKATFPDFLRAFWPLCFISFGGPAAHVALLHNKFVDVPSDHTGPFVKESTFLELFAVSQSLPGPGSTQLVTSLGATFGGLPGAALTFSLWHLPGFIVMSAAGAWFHRHLNDPASLQRINTLTDLAVGLIAAAFAFVLIAVFKIVSKTCALHRVKMTIAIVSMIISVSIPSQAASWVFIVLLVTGGIFFYLYDRFFENPNERVEDIDPEWRARVSPLAGAILIACVAVTTVVIAFLPDSDLGFRILKIFWRIGLLVFGGGIVVVPMLITEFIESGLLPTSVFLAGFGLFGCVPGPMLNLAPFLGAAIIPLKGAFYGSFGIFGPGILLQLGVLPFWERLRRVKWVQTVLQGTNSAAVGLIITGVWMLMQKALVGPASFALTCSAASLSVVFNVSPAVVIMSHGVAGVIMVLLGIGGPYHIVESL